MARTTKQTKLTPTQKAKSKYYQKNRDVIIKKIVEINKNKYYNDEVYRQYILDIHKAYYQANKEKKKQYYQMRKHKKLEQSLIIPVV